MKKQRSLSVDLAKGIAIIAIVLGHCSFDYPQYSLFTVNSLIYLWHVPVFFILGGFFIKEEQIVRPWFWFKKKFTSLYLKILFFYIPAVLLHNVFISMGWYSLQSTDPVINTYSISDFIKQIILTVCCAGREPIVGAMWFVSVLFMALIGLSIISWIISRLTSDRSKRDWACFTALLTFAVIAGILSNKYGFTIRRFSNVFSAMLLIYIGWLMNRKWELRYDNPNLMVVCALITFEVLCMLGGVSLNGNRFSDILQLIVVAPAVLYCIMYFGKKIERNSIGKVLAKIGNESFYIMALHFVGFKLCTVSLNAVGWGGNELSQLTAPAGDNILILVLYLIYGVGFPILFMFVFRKARGFLSNIISR